MDAVVEMLDPLQRLERDVRASASLLDAHQVKFLVSTYYRLQEHRIALRNQEKALDKAELPHGPLSHFARQMEVLERQMVSVLDAFTLSSPVGEWSRAQVGVGPVLAAGLLAHIDIEKAPTVGHIWRFAGLDPTSKWDKGQKRPWNAELKVLCWKLGDSFVKMSGRDDAFYGQLYRQRKELEVQRNEAGEFAEQAAETLKERKITDPATRSVYEQGRLPAGRIEARARRWAVKLFFAHWHEVAFVTRFGRDVPKPYVVEHLGHAHVLSPPGWVNPFRSSVSHV